jgi:FtsH-binding integral membrane protein
MNKDLHAQNYGYVAQPTAGRIDQALFDEGLRQHMLRVYNYMGLGLVLTGLVAIMVGTTPALYVPIFSTPLKWVAILAPLPFALFFAFRIQSMSASTAQAVFWAFCAIMGLSLASIFLVFTGTSIARTFFIAAAMFGATSLYGYTTRRDLSAIGSFLIMGLIGVVIASLVNIFVLSSALQFVVSVVGVIVFIGLTAWHTQTIKEQYGESFAAESRQKLAILGAFSLYLNLINIFQLLLNFTGEREG